MADRAHSATIAAAFPTEICARFTGAGSCAAAPIFVVGMPRSGTSLTEQILASHPAIHGADELHAPPHIAAEIGGAPEGVGDLTAGDLASLGGDYLARADEPPAGKTRVVDKAPGNFIKLGLIRLILPEAQIIHVRRAPSTPASPAAPSISRGSICPTPTTRPSSGCLIAPTRRGWRIGAPSRRRRNSLEVDCEAVVATSRRRRDG